MPPKGKKRTVPAWVAPAQRDASDEQPRFSVVATWPLHDGEEEDGQAIAKRVIRTLTNYGGQHSHGGVDFVDNKRSFRLTWEYGTDSSAARGAARALAQMSGVKHVSVIRQPGNVVIWSKRKK